jgi:hypothetical protein
MHETGAQAQNLISLFPMPKDWDFLSGHSATRVLQSCNVAYHSGTYADWRCLKTCECLYRSRALSFSKHVNAYSVQEHYRFRNMWAHIPFKSIIIFETCERIFRSRAFSFSRHVNAYSVQERYNFRNMWMFIPFKSIIVFETCERLFRSRALSFSKHVKTCECLFRSWALSFSKHVNAYSVQERYNFRNMWTLIPFKSIIIFETCECLFRSWALSFSKHGTIEWLHCKLHTRPLVKEDAP